MDKGLITKTINFSSYDGTSLVGVLTKPTGGASHALLMCHGLPSDKNEYGFYTDMSNFMAERGIASFRFDFRYNGESQKGALSSITLSELINDVESAYWILRENLDINASISVVGTSCGGGVSAAWCGIFGRKISQVFLMAPVLDWVYEVTGKQKEKCSDHFVQLAAQDVDELKSKGKLNPDVGYGYQMVNEASLFDFAREVQGLSCRITIYHGENDTVVPFDISGKYSRDLDNVDLVAISGCDHGFSVGDDDDLTSPETKDNHMLVYTDMFKRICDE